MFTKLSKKTHHAVVFVVVVVVAGAVAVAVAVVVVDLVADCCYYPNFDSHPMIVDLGHCLNQSFDYHNCPVDFECFLVIMFLNN